MRKLFLLCVAQVACLIYAHGSVEKLTPGFALPDTIREYSLQYETVNNLIVLPVVINNDIKLNLILDTGCRNLVLFGKRFNKLFDLQPDRVVEFSGMGSGRRVQGALSLHNKAAIGAVVGHDVPIVVVPSKNIFQHYPRIDGVIGYDIFIKFEIELQPFRHLITFRPALTSSVPAGYTLIPMKIVDSRPLFASNISLDGDTREWDLMFDTGSSLGLLLKSTEETQFEHLGKRDDQLIGLGLNGKVTGLVTVADLALPDFMFKEVSTGIIHSPWHNYASIGMGLLKDYSIILNYVKSYAGLKKET